MSHSTTGKGAENKQKEGNHKDKHGSSWARKGSNGPVRSLKRVVTQSLTLMPKQVSRKVWKRNRPQTLGRNLTACTRLVPAKGLFLTTDLETGPVDFLLEKYGFQNWWNKKLESPHSPQKRRSWVPAFPGSSPPILSPKCRRPDITKFTKTSKASSVLLCEVFSENKGWLSGWFLMCQLDKETEQGKARQSKT